MALGGNSPDIRIQVALVGDDQVDAAANKVRDSMSKMFPKSADGSLKTMVDNMKELNPVLDSASQQFNTVSGALDMLKTSMEGSSNGIVRFIGSLIDVDKAAMAVGKSTETLSTTSAGVAEDFAGAAAAVESFGGGAATAAGSVVGIGAAITVAVGAVSGLVLALGSIAAANIGNQAADGIKKIGDAAESAGTSISEFQRLLSGVATSGAGTTELSKGVAALRKAAFDSRDAWIGAIDAYKNKIAEMKVGDKMPEFKAPKDIFSKLDIGDMSGFDGSVNGLINKLQNKFASIGDKLQQNEFRRLIEQTFGAPLEELVQKTPQQVSDLNAAYAEIVPPLSQDQIDQSNRIKEQLGTLTKIYSDSSAQIQAAFMPASEAFNKLRLSIVGQKGAFDDFIEWAKYAGKAAADLFDIIRGDKDARESSPWIATYVDIMRDLIGAVSIAKDGLVGLKDFILGELGMALDTIQGALLKLEEAFLKYKKYAGFGGAENDQRIRENANAQFKNNQDILKDADLIIGRDPKPEPAKPKVINDEKAADRYKPLDLTDRTYPFIQKPKDDFGLNTKKDFDQLDKLNKDEADKLKKTKKDADDLKTSLDSAADSAKKLQEALPASGGDIIKALGIKGALTGQQIIDYKKLTGQDQVESEQSNTETKKKNLTEIAVIAEVAQKAFSLIAVAISSISENGEAAFSGMIQGLRSATQEGLNLLAVLREIERTKPSAGGPGAQGGAAPKMASGGLISGPGTSTSDSILSYLSNGEFVVSAKAVSAYGAGFFQSLNDMMIPSGVPGFADGGIVGQTAGLGAVDGGRNLTLVLDGKSFGGLSAPNSVMDDLEHHASLRRMSSTTRRSPSRIG